MKKFILIIAIIFALFLSAIIFAPLIFKKPIQKAVDNAMEENLNAMVLYDLDKFSLSFFKKFPDVTVSMNDFKIVGISPFEKDTLIAVDEFRVTIDLMSIIRGDQIKVEEILLDKPKIFVSVLPDGTANYAIAKQNEADSVNKETEIREEENSANQNSINISIDHWKINNGSVVYSDQSTNMYAAILELNHEGTGNFTQDIFDMTISTTVNSTSFTHNGIGYISNKKLAIDMVLNMNLAEMVFTLKKNRIAINNFAMNLTGFVNLSEEDINMDISFLGSDINLKSILSLIPSVYKESLNPITTKGIIDFDGYIKGVFNENSMPKIAANFSVKDGEINHSDFNIPIEDINIETHFNYPSADLRETSFDINKFSMLVAGEPVNAYLKFKNLENYQWDMGFEGVADLEKITKIFPLKGMKLAGKINTQLETVGQMSDVEAEKYEQLPTSGNIIVTNFSFESEEYFPQGFDISKVALSFNPKEIKLTEFIASTGNSDFTMNGEVSNYIKFILQENEPLVGRLDFNSSLIDINELMPDEQETSTTKPTEEIEKEKQELVSKEETESIKIPKNIDFTLMSSINKIKYSDLPITAFKGQIQIKEETLTLRETSFNMLDGLFKLAGKYATPVLNKPTYDLGFSIKNLSMGSAFQSFEIIKKYIPIAEQIDGKFNADIKTNGFLANDMMPILDEIDLTAKIAIADASLEKGEFIKKLSSIDILKIGSSSKQKISLKDVSISAQIKDGRMIVNPFEFEVSGQKAVVGGSNGLDGSLDYKLTVKDVSTSQIGSTVNSLVSSFTGIDNTNLIAEKINVNLGVRGTYKNPTIKLLGISNGTSVSNKSSTPTESLTKVVKKEVSKAKTKITKELKVQEKEIKKSVEKKVKAEQKKVEELAKKKLKKLFKIGGGE